MLNLQLVFQSIRITTIKFVYHRAYVFMDCKVEQNVESFSENFLMDYFAELAKMFKVLIY